MNAVFEMFVALMLVATTAFSYFHGEHGTAVIVGVCAGFVGGLAVARLIIRSRYHD